MLVSDILKSKGAPFYRFYYANVARADRDALLVPPGDPVALAAAVRRILADDALARDLVASGAERAAAFSMSRLAEVYEGLYRQAIDHAAGARG